MNRVSLDERLRALDPTRPVTNRIPLMGMTLQGFVNLLKAQGPDYKQEAYRLLQCTDANVDMHATLAEVAYKAAMSNQAVGDRILYDVFARPFLRLIREETKNE